MCVCVCVRGGGVRGQSNPSLIQNIFSWEISDIFDKYGTLVPIPLFKKSISLHDNWCKIDE